MTEKLLQFIWQFQLFNKRQLTTSCGKKIEITYPGLHNTNQGPDFLNARVKIGSILWVGSIELHLQSSHWNTHQHDIDKNYKNVILHVVWQEDKQLSLPFPTLILQDRISQILLEKYNNLLEKKSTIACEKSISQIQPLTWLSWKERLLVERLQQKSQLIFDFLLKNNNHWEETCWWLMAKSFGAKTNNEAFLAIAQSIPLNTLAKHKNQIHQIEALLFGQAGLLNDTFIEKYPTLLRKEYIFYQKKYQLKKPAFPLLFLRMRPANFPTIRLAQLAMLIHHSIHLFSKIKEARSLQEVKTLLDVTANDYWHYHYRFDEITTFKEKKIGQQMIENILINTVLPLLFSYGHLNHETIYKEKALQWFSEIQAEKNHITKIFQSLSIENKTAFDSQALIQLKNEYCNQKKCLECAVGNKILKID